MMNWTSRIRSSKSSIVSIRNAEAGVGASPRRRSMRQSRIVCLISIATFWWAMLSTALAADPLRVAVMDQQVVIEKSKAGKRALEELKAYSTTRQKIINADDQE